MFTTTNKPGRKPTPVLFKLNFWIDVKYHTVFHTSSLDIKLIRNMSGVVNTNNFYQVLKEVIKKSLNLAFVLVKERVEVALHVFF